jgi:hypothetical protein
MASLRPSEIDSLWYGLETIIRPEDRPWLLPRPVGIPQANNVSEDSAGKGAGPGSAVPLKANGRGHPDRRNAPAISGTTRRQK